MRARLDMSPLPPAPAPSLDSEQRRVVEHREGPLLVLAGPGTGKTTTIVESIVARLGEEPAESVLALTFGRRAAVELRDRIAARLGGGVLPQVATFHSFAYGLLRSTSTPDEYLDPPLLLSGAEEDQRIRELIKGAVEDGSVDWPDDLREALGTHGFAVEVRALIARMRERDVTPARLRELAAAHDRPEWAAVAGIAEQEQDVMVLQNVLDYAELMRRAVLRAGDRDVQEDLHARYRAIYVDEFQDTDPLQVALLRRIAGPECSVVAVGDPDQAIYAFRGADVRGILDFPSTFTHIDGSPADIIALRTTRRFGSPLAAAARAALAPGALPGLPREAQRAHRSPRVEAESGSVRVLTCASRASRDAHIAEQIRSAHVHHGTAYSEMAVLVRTFDDLAGLERAMKVAGVPAAVAADEIPLREEPAVAYLLTILDLAVHPERAGTEQVLDALTGPVGRLDATEIRALGRALRAERRGEGLPLLPARELIAELVLGCEPLPESVAAAPLLAAGIERVRGTLAAVAASLEFAAPVAEVLWSAWTGGDARTTGQPHGWPDRLRDAALAGSPAAHHDLDAVIALFDTAERLSERYRGVYGVTSLLATLRDQSIPAESVADGGDDRGRDLVRIMTVHRAKGLEWSRVWVAGLEEGLWPNLRPRGSLLGVQEFDEALETGMDSDPIAELIREERNLLYVACTRARDSLTLLTVDSGEAGEDRPSRFVEDLTAAGVPMEVLGVRSGVVASWPALLAELRTVSMDPQAPEFARAEATALLAAMTGLLDDHGRQLVPGADPDRWWGVHELSSGPLPLREDTEPITLSGSSLDTLRQCSLKWFLDHEVHAETVRSSSTAFGSIVHAIADHVAKGDVPEDIDAMDEFVDRVWSAVEFEASWRSESERREARRSLERFLRYHQDRLRQLVDTEQYLRTTVDVPTPRGTVAEVTIHGYLDRIERDEDSRLVAVDLKTTNSVPTKAETADHGQLGLYQLLLREAYPQAPDNDAVGGAALVQLRKDAGADDPGPKEQRQGALGEERPTWIEAALGEAVDVVRGEDIAAQVGKQCTFCAFTRICPAKNTEVSIISLAEGPERP